MTQKLQIIDYFDSLINDIDLKAERLLTKIPESYQEYVNVKRRSFIDEIELIKQYNLSNFESYDSPESLRKEQLFMRYCFCLDMDQMNGHRFISDRIENYYEERQEDMKVDELFNEIINKAFGILIILDGYLSDEKLSLYRELLHFHECYVWSNDIVERAEFDNIHHVASMLNKSNLYCPFTPGAKSLIFESKYHDLNQLYWMIWLQYDIFKTFNGFIVKTTLEELFKVNYLRFYKLTIDSINDEALELLRGDITLFVYIYNDMNKLDESLDRLKRLQARLNIVKLNLIVDGDYFDMELFNSHKVQNLNMLTICLERSPVNDVSFERVHLSDLSKLVITSKSQVDQMEIFTNKVVSLQNLTHLEQLTLTRQNIQQLKLDSFCFTGLGLLRELKLPSNSINFIGSRTFTSLINLNTLDLNSNKINFIDDDAFYGLEKLKNLYLFSNKLNSLLFLDHLTGLTVLKLSFNLIGELASGVFGRLSRLERLELAENRIDQVENRAFSTLANLKMLNLSSNKSINLAQDTFVDLNNLEELDLSYCAIKTMNHVNLDRLNNLKKIHLQSNEIDSLASDLFRGLSNVQLINLSYNRLSKVDCDVFTASLTSLTKLNLTGNDLTHVENNSFSHLTNLTELSLNCQKINPSLKLIENMNKLVNLEMSFSNIIDLTWELFEKFTQLRSLNLVGNLIGSLGANMFSTLSNLLDLSLSKNQIEYVDQRAFQGLANLTELYLSVNKISHIPNRTFHGLRNLQKLTLHTNQIESLAFLNDESLANLKYLRLDGNRLENIESTDLGHLFSLLTLNLQSNRIKTINFRVFTNLHFLRELKLLNNPIESYEFLTRLELRNFKYLQIDTITNEIRSKLFDNFKYLKKLVDYEFIP